MAQGTPDVKTPEGQATFPLIFTVTMYDGHGTPTERDAVGGSYDGEATYPSMATVSFDSGGGIVDTSAFRLTTTARCISRRNMRRILVACSS